MSRALAARLAKLEAKTAPKIIGVIATRFPPRIEEINGVLHLVPGMSHAEFCDFAKQQQAELQSEVSKLAADLDADSTSHPVNVGKSPAMPKPEGFVFQHNEIEFVIANGQARPLKLKRN